MTIWNAILLGLVQGIAEFLPISSSGHLSILQNLFHMSTAEDGHLFLTCCCIWAHSFRFASSIGGHRGHGCARRFAFFGNTRLPAEQRPEAVSCGAHGAYDHPCDAAAVPDPADQRQGGAAVLPHVFHRPHADPHGLSAVRGR